MTQPTVATGSAGKVTVSFATNGGQVKELSLPPGSRVADVLREAKVKPQKGDNIFHNGQPVKIGGLFGNQGPAVKTGDKVTMTPKVAGG